MYKFILLLLQLVGIQIKNAMHYHSCETYIRIKLSLGFNVFVYLINTGFWRQFRQYLESVLEQEDKFCEQYKTNNKYRIWGQIRMLGSCTKKNRIKPTVKYGLLNLNTVGFRPKTDQNTRTVLKWSVMNFNIKRRRNLFYDDYF